MPRRNPISPTVAPTYADSRAPAARTSRTLPAEACSPEATNTIAPTYPAPNTAQARVCHPALPHRARDTSAYQRSQAVRRWPTSRSPMPVSRTSLPGAAVVAVTNRCRASRLPAAPRSSAVRSTAGRQLDVSTVGSAHRASSASAGCTDISSATVTPSRRIQPHVENTDMYMWSRTNTWSRRTASRSSSSGRSWWAIVVTDACRRATWPSSTIVTLSRKRRWTRVPTTRRYQLAVADAARPAAAPSTAPRSCRRTSSPSSLSHTAMRASGSAANRDNRKAASSRPGSCR